MKNKKLVVSVIEGTSFAALSFVVSGLTSGFAWWKLLPCTASGIIFALLGRFIKIGEFNPSDKRAQKQLEEYAATLGLVSEHRYSGFIFRGEGIRQAYCESLLFFLDDRICILHWYFRKLYKADFPYEKLRTAYLNDKNFIVSTDDFGVGFILKNDSEKYEIEKLINERGIEKNPNNI